MIPWLRRARPAVVPPTVPCGPQTLAGRLRAQARVPDIDLEWLPRDLEPGPRAKRGDPCGDPPLHGRRR